MSIVLAYGERIDEQQFTEFARRIKSSPVLSCLGGWCKLRQCLLRSCRVTIICSPSLNILGVGNARIRDNTILRLHPSRSNEGDFLPDLCTVQAVLSLILVGELLAFAFVLIDHGLQSFKWLHFGAVSFLTQWIILVSAACLCPLRPWFRRQNGLVAGSVSYSLVLAVTGIFSLSGLLLTGKTFASHSYILLENMVIAAVFAGVVLRYFYLQQQLHNREQAELKSRIQALQSRIRPHFLFNSMNSIASLIDIDPKAAEKMVVDLSQLFRVSLSESALVPILDEIQLCQQFVSIEQIRLGSRLNIEWDIDVPAASPSTSVADGGGDGDIYVVPSLLIQPLIENAIYHGIQPLPGGGTVKVCVKCGAKHVGIHVHNPIAPNRSGDRSSHNGMALENIQHRLYAHFGDNVSMKYSETCEAFSIDIKYCVSLAVNNPSKEEH